MFYFSGTRKPDFKNISQNIYGDYWQSRDFKLREKLMEREKIFFDWIKPNSRVLSVGCGNSRLLLDLKEKKTCEVFGLDIENGIVAELNKIGIEAVVADAGKEDFDLKKYFEEAKFVVCVYVILCEISQ